MNGDNALKERIRARLKRSASAMLLNNALQWRLHRLQEWLTLHVSRGLRQARSPHGFLFTAERTATGRKMQSGEFEPDEVGCITDALEHADVFVDIGANLGLFSCLAAARGLHTISVEPQRRNLEVLRRNLSDNGWNRSEVIPVALSDAPGELTLYGASGTSASLVEGWAGMSRRSTQVVRVDTLDALLGSRFAGERVLIKVDIEGAEYGMLQGARQTLRADPAPVWMVEVFLEHHYPGHRNPNYLRTFECFWNAGYNAFTVRTPLTAVSPVEIKRWVDRGYADPGAYNFLFRKPA